MKPHKPLFRWIISMITIVLILSSCNLPGRQVSTQEPANAIYTAAAETVQAQFTQVNQAPPTGDLPTLTITPPELSPTTAQVTEITIPTSTLSATTAPTISPTKPPCDLVKFIQDVTIPDNTKMAPGADFTKTWRLQNAGSCIWTSVYGITYEGDNLLNAPSFSPITSGTVPPGQSVDITVNLTAPDTGGVYRQNFKLVNASGDKFALGDGSKPFWAQIEVVLPGGVALDFLTQASQAEWRSGVGNDLNIPVVFNGPDEDLNGTAKIKDGVKLETGAISGKVLLTIPKHEANGTIAGTFPAYLVQTGDRLRGRIGFLSNADGTCGAGKVTFQIFTIDNSSTKLLSEWSKSCDGSFLPINIDLSSLKGKNIQFILVVRAGTSIQDDWAIWNSLRVER